MANYLALFHASLLDGREVRGTVLNRAVIAEASTVTEIAAALNAWVTLLGAITNGQVLNSGVDLIINDTPLAQPATYADSRAQETAVFDYAQAGTSAHAAVAVPTFLDTKFDTRHEPNDTDTDVAAWEAGNTGTVLGGHWVSLQGNALGDFVYSFYSSRKRRKRAQRGQ